MARQRATRHGVEDIDSGLHRSAGAGQEKPKKRKSRKRGPLWAKLVGMFGVLMIIVGFGGVAAAKYYLGQLTDNIEITTSALSDDTGSGASTNATSAGKLPTGAMNLLLLGVDTRAGWDKQGLLSRADTIIILHISATHDQAYMISIPRDTYAQIPSDKKLDFTGYTTKINGAYAHGSDHGHGWQGGARLTAEAVNRLTGVTFDGVVVIDFAGFQRVIRAMGGVYMCVDKDTWSSHYSYGPKGTHVYDKGREGAWKPGSWIHKKGCREMAEWEALDYARQRDGLPNTDYDRQKHQQQLIRAMAKKATGAGILTNPTKLTALVRAAGGSLKMDTHGVPLTDFVYGLKSIAGADLIALKTNSGTYARSATGEGEGISSATQRLFQAAKNDTLGQFVMENPEYLVPDASGL